MSLTPDVPYRVLDRVNPWGCAGIRVFPSGHHDGLVSTVKRVTVSLGRGMAREELAAPGCRWRESAGSRVDAMHPPRPVSPQLVSSPVIPTTERWTL